MKAYCKVFPHQICETIVNHYRAYEFGGSDDQDKRFQFGTVQDGIILKYKLIENEKIIYTFWLDNRSFEKGLLNIEKEINICKNERYNLSNQKEIKEFVGMLNYLKFNVKNSMFGPKWLPPTRVSSRINKFDGSKLQNLLQIPRASNTTTRAGQGRRSANVGSNESENSASSVSYHHIGGLQIDTNLQKELKNTNQQVQFELHEKTPYPADDTSESQDSDSRRS